MIAKMAHDKATRRVMTFCSNTGDLSVLITPGWKGILNYNYYLKISGISDYNYAKDMQTWISMSGFATFEMEP